MLNKFGNIFKHIALLGTVIIAISFFTSRIDAPWGFIVMGSLGLSIRAVRDSVLHNQNKPPMTDYYHFSFFVLLINYGLARIAESNILSGIFYVIAAISLLFWLRDYTLAISKPAPLDE